MGKGSSDFDTEAEYTNKSNGVCSRSRRRALGVGFLVIGVGSFLTVYFTVIGVDKAVAADSSVDIEADFVAEQPIDETCDDIAIIGGGIAGTYAAWKLKERGLAISLYEYSDRIGGRMHTIQFQGIPDINVELGAMRFLPQAHPLIVETAKAVNLSIVKFAPGMGIRDDDMFYLRGVHLRRGDLGNKDNPYNLEPDELPYRNDPDRLKWEYFIKKTSIGPNTTLNEHLMMYTKTEDGTPLYQQSGDVALSTMGVSQEAVMYFRDTFGYHSFFDDVTAAVVVPARAPSKVSLDNITVGTIGEGMEALPKALANEFTNASTRHQVKFHHELRKIEKQQDKTYKLSFSPTETVNGNARRVQDQKEVSICAKKVILCIPRLPLESVGWEGLRTPEIDKVVKEAIKDAPAAKVFLAYDYPWWRDLDVTFSHSVSDLSNRQTYDFGTSAHSNRSVLMAAFTDSDGVKFWRELVSRGTTSSGQTFPINDQILYHLNSNLAKVFNISVSAIPRPREGKVSLWDEYPFGAAWHVWMPGYDWDKTQKRMIQPSQSDPVFIASNGFAHAFSSSWSETAFELVNIVIEKIDGK